MFVCVFRGGGGGVVKRTLSWKFNNGGRKIPKKNGRANFNRANGKTCYAIITRGKLRRGGFFRRAENLSHSRRNQRSGRIIWKCCTHIGFGRKMYEFSFASKWTIPSIFHTIWIYRILMETKWNVFIFLSSDFQWIFHWIIYEQILYIIYRKIITMLWF